MKILSTWVLFLSLSTTVFANDLKGHCEGKTVGGKEIKFDMIQTDFETSSYRFEGSKKTFVGWKAFEARAKFDGIYKTQFYAFKLEDEIVNGTDYLLIRRENYSKTDDPDAFLVNSKGEILAKLSCEDLSRR
jgi:hypothetical protein